MASENIAASPFLHALPGRLGRAVLGRLGATGRWLLFFLGALARVVQPPVRRKQIVEQMFLIGYKSVGIILLTSTFTGMVLTLQGYNALTRFGSEKYVGPLVALSLVRELGPVLAALMVSARAGSAIAATIGNMRVTEQIDAIKALAVDPIHYLVMPRTVAALIVVPMVTAFFSLFGTAAGYIFGVNVLGLDGGTFITNVREAVSWTDISSGIWKSVVFAALIAWISTYRGYFTSGGSMGVGRATMQAVVEISALVLVGDYIMTALLF